MNAFLEGALFGLTLTILLGPIFIILTQTTVQHGYKAGLIASSGVWVSDLLFISISYAVIVGLQSNIQTEQYQEIGSLIGGITMIVFGIFVLVNKQKRKLETRSLSAKKAIGFWMKGFLINTVNPFTFIFWIGIMGSYVIGKGLSKREGLLFILGIMTMIILGDITKVLLAHKVTEKRKDKFLFIFSRLAGIGLICFGFYLIYKGYFNKLSD